MSATSSGSVHPLLPPGKAHLIPVEILSEIFLLVLLDRPQAKERSAWSLCANAGILL